MPDSEGELAPSSYIVSFSPNGQCFSPGSKATFSTYNSQVNGLAISGAPANQAISLTINGAGFANLTGGICRFTSLRTAAGGSTLRVDTALEPRSETLVVCPTPAGGSPDRFTVQVLQNGIDPEPAVGGDPEFDEYDLANVRVTRVEPPAGIAGMKTAVTVHGNGFASYGEGMLKCKAGDIIVDADRVLDVNRILCTLPGISDTGDVPVTVSLSGGTDGTFSADSVNFKQYYPPFIESVTPDTAMASGGEMVTIAGKGFTKLSPTNAAVRLQYLRCKFGDEVQDEPPVSHSDKEVVCRTTWGSGYLPVSVALNAATFEGRTTEVETTSLMARANLPLLQYEGLHPPALIEVHFDGQASTLYVRFDAQATNRAGMNGIAPCSTVLDDATATTLKGTGTEDASCDWEDDYTLIALLASTTGANGGMRVNVRPNVLWPLGYDLPCDDVSAGISMCTQAVHLDVNADFPCDRRDTAEIEECVTPSAVLQAPTEIDSCAGTSLLLDATRSTGGGVRPLVFEWYSDSPSKCNNWPEIGPRLDAATANGGITSLLLTGNELDGGTRFIITLRVLNFLGQASEPTTTTIYKASIPLPNIAIQAPPLLTFPATQTVSLEAQSEIASCFDPNGTASILFSWAHVGSDGNSTAAPLVLDPASRVMRDLSIAGSTLSPGVTYTLRATGCMSTNTAVCGTADTTVALRNEPLEATVAGGDRTIGNTDSVDLDACASTDADAPNAVCDSPTGTCESGISMDWRCTPSAVSTIAGSHVLDAVMGTASCGLTAPTSSSCTRRRGIELVTTCLAPPQ